MACEGADPRGQEWTIRVCPDSYAGGESPCHRKCGLSRDVQVVPASLLREIEAERDEALSDRDFWAGSAQHWRELAERLEATWATGVAREALAPDQPEQEG